MDAVRKEILPQVYLTCLRTEKFKTSCLSISLLTQLSRETASKNALIPRVLRMGSTAHPDMESLAARLDELYGAVLYPAVRKRGEILATGFISAFPDDAYLPTGTRLLENAAALMGEVLLSPNTRGGLFLPQYVEVEREKLLDDIRARTNDRASYALCRLLELMCPAEDYAVDRLGTLDEAEGVTYLNLTRHYRTLLSSAPIEIFYCGSADYERTEQALLEALAGIPRGEPDMDLGTEVRMNAMEEAPRYFTEDMDLSQGQLAIGFRLGECMESPDPAALKVFNTVFGGGVTSKLFMNVREKLSLCYHVGSSTDWMKGICTAIAGIDPSNCDEAREEIFRQLDAMRAGAVTDEEMNSARRYLISALRAAEDSPAELENFWLTQNLVGLEYGPDILSALVEDVTKERVTAIANSLECDAVFFLRGGEGESDDGED